MSKSRSISEARKDLPRLIREAESGTPIELTRRGESVAVLIGRDDYERLASRTVCFTDAWKRFLASVDLAEVNLDPDEIFANVRDRTSGRNS